MAELSLRPFGLTTDFSAGARLACSAIDLVLERACISARRPIGSHVYLSRLVVESPRIYHEIPVNGEI